MRRPMLRSAAAVTVAALAMSAGAFAPAAAETIKLKDRRDMRSGLDIRSVKTSHTQRRVSVKVEVRNLGRRTTGKIGVYLDSKRTHKGSDYVTAIQLLEHEGPLVELKRTKSNGTPTEVVRCELDHRAKYGREVVVLRVPRNCIGRPGKVRFVAATKDGGKTDVAPNRARWSPYVQRG